MAKPEIPVWEKAVLSAEEAAAYGNISPQIVRAHAFLAKVGKSNFPAFWVGNTLKVHREEYNHWLKELAMGHCKLEIKTVQSIIAEANQPATPGRKRRNRLNKGV